MSIKAHTHKPLAHDECGCCRGFTLIEMMITLLIAMVLIAGLFLNFTVQSRQYAYQDKRADAMQDLELALRYIAKDIQRSLVSASGCEATGAGVCSIKYDGAAATSTSYLSMQVWDEDAATYHGSPVPADKRATRCYVYRSNTGAASTRQQIYVNKHKPGCASGMSVTGFDVVIGEPLSGKQGMPVTHFRIFKDGVDSRAGYSDIPPALPKKAVRDNKNNQQMMPAFTILIELEVDAAYPGASPKDVLGNVLPVNSKKRIWRYMQVYPDVFVTP